MTGIEENRESELIQSCLKSNYYFKYLWLGSKKAQELVKMGSY